MTGFPLLDLSLSLSNILVFIPCVITETWGMSNENYLQIFFVELIKEISFLFVTEACGFTTALIITKAVTVSITVKYPFN